MAYTTINKGSDYFNTLLWTGNGGTQSVTGVGFAPDFVWIKRRNALAGHKVNDTVRGVNKQLTTNNTNAEGTDTNQLTAFGSDGFTLGNNADVNASGGTFVGWNWLGGGTASSNSDGSITSTVSANTTSGFSIVSYTGTGSNATVGHGLGVAPAMVIVKIRSAAGENWNCYHQALGGTQYIQLNNLNAADAASNIWQDTNPTSSFFSIGTHSSVNTSSATYIAYCFADVKGFSKIGSYTGNGSTDGTFVYTGFKPAMVIWKEDAVRGWYMMDNKRNTFNVTNNFVRPNDSAAESTAANSIADFLSNGFKLRGTGSDVNGSGSTYIYMAIAENPFTTSSGVPCTAR
jgi:hypothetical protein